jgi:hypothetical protein
MAVGAASASTAASSSSEDDARATARAFVDALAHNDAQRVCSLFSPDALSRLGGRDNCLKSMTNDDEDEADYAAMDVLQRGYTVARLSATKRKGQFVTKRFGPRKLAHDMEQLGPDLTVKLGRSYNSAKGQLATTIILDTRSTARQLVLYVESDDGSIIRLMATATGRPSYEEVGTGIPETSQPSNTPPSGTFNATIDSVTIDSAGTAFARGTLLVSFPDVDATFRYGILIALVQVNGSYYVDDLFYSTFTSGAEDGG